MEPQYATMFCEDNEEKTDVGINQCPIPSKNRTRTNHEFLIVLGVAIAVVILFSAIVWSQADYKDYLNRETVSFKNDYRYQTTRSHTTFGHVEIDVKSILSVACIGLALTLFMLVLFRFCPGIVVWTILIGTILALGWVTFQLYLAKLTIPAIIFTIFDLIILLIVTVLFKRIKLLILLMKETTKVIFDMPMLLLQPIPTIIAYIIMYICYVAVILAIVFSSPLTFSYGFSRFVLTLSSIGCVWLSHFFIGCQYMAIAGAVVRHYFASDKSTLTFFGPIYQSYEVMIKYHLGTIALSSAILMIFGYFKRLLHCIVKRSCCCCLCFFCLRCWLNQLEGFLKFLSKNVYIVTAMHGLPFFESAKKAIQLLVDNCVSTIAINFIGSFILGMCQVLILLATVGLGFLAEELPSGVVIGLWITLIITAMVFTVFECTMDTLFLCFCEDLQLNNGLDKPYYMSKGLMLYIEEAKKAYKVVELTPPPN